MITVHDFTVLPEGLFVPLDGTVVRCPRCGRNGVVQRTDAGASERCLHEETTVVLGDGMLVEPTDSCELPPLL